MAGDHERVLEAFRRHDASKSGLIHKEALRQLLDKLGLAPKLTSRFIEKVPPNPDGYLSYEKFLVEVYRSTTGADSLRPPLASWVGLPRARGAVGQFLRIVMVNDVHKIENYPPLAELLRQLKAQQSELRCKVVSVLAGDFLSPCVLSALDAGKAMADVLNLVPFDYVCFGDREFDIGPRLLQHRTKHFRGTWLNGNVISPAFVDREGRQLPQSGIEWVGHRRVCFSGFMTTDKGSIRPGCDVETMPPAKAMQEVWGSAQQAHGALDLFVPLTHMSVAEDRATIKEVAASTPSLAAKMPVVCGGHEHEVHSESVGNTLILKVGRDASNAGIVDIWWDAQQKAQVSFHLLPLAGLEASQCCACKAFAEKQQAFLETVKVTEIFRLRTDAATNRVGFESCSLVARLLRLAKWALHGVELVMLPGAALRGRTTYRAGPFTYRDLLAELPDDTRIAVIDLPGSIIAESIRNTRCSPDDQERPAFLQTDSDSHFAEADPKVLTHINLQPIDPSRTYRVAVLDLLLKGEIAVEPLLSYARENVKVPTAQQCFLAKVLIIEACMKISWRKILGDSRDIDEALAGLDVAGTGRVSKAELQVRLAEMDSTADADNDVSVALVGKLIDTLDADHNGTICKTEFHKVAQWILVGAS